MFWLLFGGYVDYGCLSCLNFLFDSVSDVVVMLFFRCVVWLVFGIGSIIGLCCSS